MNNDKQQMPRTDLEDFEREGSRGCRLWCPVGLSLSSGGSTLWSFPVEPQQNSHLSADPLGQLPWSRTPTWGTLAR